MEMEPGKLFIGGISWDTNEDRLREYFQTFGEVVEAMIMKDRNTGRARGFGFVVFADPSIAERVVREEHIIDGRTKECCPSIFVHEQKPDHGMEQLSLQNDLMPMETRIGENFLYKATTVIAAADQIAFHILGVLEAFFGMETHNFAVQWPDRG